MIDFILRSPDFLMWMGFILFTGAISAALEEIRKAKLLKQ